MIVVKVWPDSSWWQWQIDDDRPPAQRMSGDAPDLRTAAQRAASALALTAVRSLP